MRSGRRATPHSYVKIVFNNPTRAPSTRARHGTRACGVVRKYLGGGLDSPVVQWITSGVSRA
eukprot:1196099-Prorocentrum_minimum.AAC.6